MEVMGRPTTSSIGVVFNGYDTVPRHASPLYEAALEGILLFIIMFCLWKFTKLKEHAGALSGIFAMLYAVFRIIAEQFRAPDVQIGFIGGDWLTMGAALSFVMFIAGLAVFSYSMKTK
jgi:phosphatidylglycerol:prolipoprotein diacylglycerol transferase